MQANNKVYLVKALVTRPDDLSSILTIHELKGEKPTHASCLLNSIYIPGHPYVSLYTQILNMFTLHVAM